MKKYFFISFTSILMVAIGLGLNTSLSAQIILAESKVKIAADIVFEEPEDYVIYDKVPHQMVRVKVSDKSGKPVAFVPVEFSSSDPGIVDFIFSETIADSNGIAVSIIQIQVGEDEIIEGHIEHRIRIPLIMAKVGRVESKKVPVKIMWGVIVDPSFMGPFFDGLFNSFSEITASTGDTFTVKGKLVRALGGLPPLGTTFAAYNTDPHIAKAEQAVVDSEKGDDIGLVTTTIHCLKDGTTNIIFEGIPPAVIKIDVRGPSISHPRSKLATTWADIKTNYTKEKMNEAN